MYGFVCFQSLLIITCSNEGTVSLLICHGKKKDFLQKVKAYWIWKTCMSSRKCRVGYKILQQSNLQINVSIIQYREDKQF